MDTQKIVTDLKNEKERLDLAIAALEKPDAHPKSSKSPTANKISEPAGKLTGQRLTAEGRKRLSESMKKRWAERRKRA